MCIVSFVGTDYKDKFPSRWPQFPNPGDLSPTYFVEYATKEDLNKLRKEVEELVKLLKAAKIFDKETGQEDCEMDEKVQFIKDLAGFLEVDLEDVFAE